MKPKVTVGTCVRNCEGFVEEAIESIIGQDFPHELMEAVFVDDGSIDETLSIMKSYVPRMDMKVKVFHQKWRGLGPARNVVVDNASGDYIVWVDGDMVLPRDYVRRQVEFMEQHLEVGIAKGKQALESGGNLLATLETYSRAASRMVDYNSEKARSKPMGTGGCIYRAEAIRQVGGFDENIRGYGEDWDFEYRLRKLGWLLSTTNIQFRDYERRRISWKDLWRRYLQRGYDLCYFSRKNKGLIKLYRMLPPAGFLSGLRDALILYKILRRKLVFLLLFHHMFKITAWCWGFLKAKLSNTGMPLSQNMHPCTFRAKGRLKICLISHYDMIQRDTGGSIRTYYLAKSLAAQGHEVSVIIPGVKERIQLIDGILVKEINGILPYGLLRFFGILLRVSRAASLYLYDPSFLLRVFTTISKSDIVQIDTPVPAGAFIAFFISKIFRKSVVVDSHDAFQALRIRYLNPLRRVFELSMEKIAYMCAKLVLTVSEKDRRLLIRYRIRQSKIVVIPNGVDTTVFEPLVNVDGIKNRYDLKSFPTVVFVGNMEYAPNQEAVYEITTKLAPKIVSKIHNVRFLMVGRKPPKLPSASSLVFTGVVHNVALLLAVSDVAIAPLLHGSGTRLKILEYLSCNLPVVSTSVGVEGLNVKNGVHVLIEDDMDRFSAKVIELLRNEKLRKSLGNSGRELVVREYDWHEIGKVLSSSLSSIDAPQFGASASKDEELIK